MTLIVLALLLLMALVVRRHRRGLATSMAGASLLLFLATACGLLPGWMLDDLQSSYPASFSGPWAARNAIVLLGAGTTPARPGVALEPTLSGYGRIAQAAGLYRDCKGSGQRCVLLVSGGDAQHHGTPEAVVYAGVLHRLGVSAQDLLLETHSMNTWQNAQFSRPLLLALAPQRLLLVSSGIHLRRSLLYFAHFALRPTPVCGDELDATLSPWPLAWNMALADAAWHEYMGIARYDAYNAMGWNAPPVIGPIVPGAPS
jgi:uncharacterized SAM-binding protein YcdF (DUF218 family)